MNVEFALTQGQVVVRQGEDCESLAFLFVRGLAVGFGVVKAVLLQAKPKRYYHKQQKYCS